MWPGVAIAVSSDIAEPDHLAVAHDASTCAGGNGFSMPDCGSSLRRNAACEHLGRRGEATSVRAGQPLQLGDAADMVEMLVAVQDDILMSREPKAKLPDVVAR